MNWRRSRLWIFVIAAFVILIAAWSLLISIARRNTPEQVPLESPSQPAIPENGS